MTVTSLCVGCAAQRTLSEEELRFILAHHWQRLGLTLSHTDFTDAEAMAAGAAFPQPKAFAAASKTARRRSSFRFLRRNSSGSIPTVCASSSMWLSRAKWLAVAARPR